jgi:hypothetical protein
MLAMILVRARAGLLGGPGCRQRSAHFGRAIESPVPPHRKEPQAPALAQAPPRRWRARRLAGVGRHRRVGPAQLLRYIRWRRGGTR